MMWKTCTQYHWKKNLKILINEKINHIYGSEGSVLPGYQFFQN